MSEDKREDIELAKELYEFLLGIVPEGIHVQAESIPKLTPEQAWTVVWYLGNQYQAISDNIEKCCVCGELYDSYKCGDCLDFGEPPYHFCDDCIYSPEYDRKRANP